MKYIFFILILAASMQPASANTAAGRVVFSSGNSTATSPAGERRALKQGDIVQSGDKLQTDNGQLQVRFSDSGFLSLKPKSQIVINEYAFNGREDGTEKAFFSLLKGSLRAVSGAIGKHNKSAYKYQTPVATIGIRGTAFVLSFCNKDCYGSDGSLLPDGLYVNNGEGRVYIENKEGVIDLVRGQFAFVKDIGSEPEQITEPPAMREMILEEGENYDFDYRSAGDAVEEIRTNPVANLEIHNIGSVAFTMVGDDLVLAENHTDSNADITTDGFAVTKFADAAASFDSGSARLIEGRSGIDPVSAAAWGIWQGDFRYTDEATGQMETSPRYLAYMGFVNPTDSVRLPGSGTATFNVQLNPAANGAVNIVTGALSESFTASISVDWQTAMFSDFDLAARFSDGSRFDMQMQGTFQSIDNSSVPLTGTVDGVAGSGGAAFQFANNATVIGGSFHVNSDSGPAAVGTFLLGDERVDVLEPLPDLHQD
ncbi:MAG TPA: FecR family protein [Gammaproteobacteria bacterium]|nr:FecR family protein [Gammaproteobacteria bacterium]